MFKVTSRLYNRILFKKAEIEKFLEYWDMELMFDYDKQAYLKFIWNVIFNKVNNSSTVINWIKFLKYFLTLHHILLGMYLLSPVFLENIFYV
jgi:hypothetical protein